MAEEYLSPEQQLTLMNIDLQIEEIIRDLDEIMEWPVDHEDRTLVLQYLRWAYIEGYVTDREGAHPSLVEAASQRRRFNSD